MSIAARSLPASIVANPDLDTWIRIETDQTVTVFTGKVELGQGLRNAIQRIAADELDVALDRIRVETADTARGPNEGMTVGSMSMSDGGTAMRQAAAEARAHLIALAEAELDVSRAHLRVEDGRIVAPDGRSTNYWQLLGGARFESTISGEVEPKRPDQYRYIGKPGPRTDMPGLVTGTARFVQDLQLPGMLHGRIVRPPSPGARLESVDEAQVGELPGVVQVVRNGGFLGVVAQREEQALAAATVLRARARWSEHDTLPLSRQLSNWLRAQPTRDFNVIDGQPVEGAIPQIHDPDGAVQTLEATYSRPYVMHGSIGPAAAVAKWGPDGTLTVWTSAQGTFPLREAIAQALRLNAELVRAIHVDGPGCYGHNGAEDVSLDAALLARRVAPRPVLVKWTREDEHCWEPYGPPMVVKTRASLDRSGCLLDWNLDVWGTAHVSRALPHGEHTALLSAWQLESPLPRQPPSPGMEPEFGLHRNATPLYTVPRRRIVSHFVEAMPLRTSSLRALGAFANVFAIESFMDELAAVARVDPLEFRLAYLDDERARAVLNAAAERVNWRSQTEPEFGRGRGIGVARYKNTASYAAVIVDVHVDDATAKVLVERAVVAADAGQIVDPEGLTNQLEGGLVQSTSWTLKEAVQFDRTRITSVDWNSYPILTFPEVPEIETVLINRPGMPFLGAGEATQGPTAAAIGNAVFDAIGVRVRDLPFTPDRIRAAVAAADL